MQQTSKQAKKQSKQAQHNHTQASLLFQPLWKALLSISTTTAMVVF
jgi:hypothetical protein